LVGRFHLYAKEDMLMYRQVINLSYSYTYILLLKKGSFSLVMV